MTKTKVQLRREAVKRLRQFDTSDDTKSIQNGEKDKFDTF